MGGTDTCPQIAQPSVLTYFRTGVGVRSTRGLGVSSQAGIPPVLRTPTIVRSNPI